MLGALAFGIGCFSLVVIALAGDLQVYGRELSRMQYWLFFSWQCEVFFLMDVEC